VVWQPARLRMHLGSFTTDSLGDTMKSNREGCAFRTCGLPRVNRTLCQAILLVAAALTSVAAQAQTVDEVIARNIQARGGLEKIKAIHTLRNTSKLSFGSFRATYLQENKRPDKVREEFALQGLAQVLVYDGKIAWQISPFEGRKDPQLMTAEDAKSLIVDSDIEGPLVDYQAKGHKAELLGHDSVEGTDCFKVRLAMKNGDVRYYYLDADSFLELKLEVQTTIRGTLQETEQYFGDYEKVDGVYYPFAVEQAQKGNAQRQKLSVEKIEINVPVDDARFVMPVVKPAEKAPTAK
jgi:outer membrane lipoprotein-sorting protein